MALLKRLEAVAKRLLVLWAAAVLWRPWRRAARALALRRAERILLVRIDNRVGEALLTTPLLTRLKARRPGTRVDVLAHARCARVLDGHPAADRVIPFARRRLWLGPLAPELRALRAERYDVVVDCGNWSEPSVTSALVARLIGSRGAVLGPAGSSVRLLHSHPVAPLAGMSGEVAQRLHLLSPLGEGLEGSEPLSFRRPVVRPGFEPWLEEVRSAPHAVVNPGGRLGYRRIPPEAFAAAARALASAGRRVLVTWGPGEEALAKQVVELAPGARLAPPTGLDELAALMAAAGLTVCNNTGPMHLSVAVGAPTLALFFRVELERWGHSHPPHRMVDLTPVVDAGEDLLARVAGESLRFARALERPGRAAPAPDVSPG